MNWIKVEDRLPEIVHDNGTSNYVLVRESGDDFFVAHLNFYPAKGYRKTDEWIWSENSTGCGCCGRSLNPTHWMILPDLPKDEE